VKLHARPTAVHALLTAIAAAVTAVMTMTAASFVRPTPLIAFTTARNMRTVRTRLTAKA